MASSRMELGNMLFYSLVVDSQPKPVRELDYLARKREELCASLVRHM